MPLQPQLSNPSFLDCGSRTYWHDLKNDDSRHGEIP
jgi:hypothetical protein